VICPKKVGGRVCEYMHARAIYNVLTQGRTVQKGGLKPPTNHTLVTGRFVVKHTGTALWDLEIIQYLPFNFSVASDYRY